MGKTSTRMTRFARTFVHRQTKMSLVPEQSRRGFSDQKVVELISGTKLSPQPTRLFATAGPCLAPIFRIAIFGENLRIRTPLTLQRRAFDSGTELSQPVLQHSSFRRHLMAQLCNH